MFVLELLCWKCAIHIWTNPYPLPAAISLSFVNCAAASGSTGSTHLTSNHPTAFEFIRSPYNIGGELWSFVRFDPIRILSPNQNTYQLHFETQRNALNDNDTTTITTPTATAAHRATIINYRYDDMDETDYRPVAATTAARNAGDVAARRHHQLLEKRRARSVFCCPDTLRVKSLLARPGGAVKVTATAPRDDDSSDDGDTDEDDGDAGADDTIGDNDEDDDDDSDHGAECEEVGVGDDGLLASPVDAQSAHNASTAQAQHTTTVAQSTMLPPDVITLSPARLLADGQASVRTSEEAVSFARSHTVGGGSCSSGSQVQFLSDRHLDKMNGFDAAATATAMPSISDRTQDDLIEFVFTSHGIRVISNKEYVV